jgi:hypothetical protein
MRQVGSIVGVALVLMCLSGTAAVLACSEPYAPSCAAWSGRFEEEWEFDRCQRDMRNYRDEVEHYLSCVANEARQVSEEAQRVNDEARRKSQEAIDEYEEAVEGFNRRARG